MVGDQTKKVRALIDENNNKIKEAKPSSPVIVSGLEIPPEAGKEFIVVSSEKMAKEISAERSEQLREKSCS